jgi:hypothetical protein
MAGAIPPKVFLYICLIYLHCLSIDHSQSLALEECRARALAPEEGFDGLECMDLEAQGATFDSCALAKPTAPTFSSTVAPTVDDVEALIDETVPGPSRQVSAPRSPAASPAASSVASPPSLRATPPLSNAGSPPQSRTGSPTAPHAASTPHTRPVGVSLPHLPSASRSLSPPSPSPRSRSPRSLPAPPLQKRKRADEEPLAAQRKSKRSKAVASTAVVPASSPAPPVQTRKRANNDSSVAQRTSKRSKVASSAAVIPGWFSSVLEMLQSPETPLGEHWAILVELWVEFKKKEGFKEQGFLPAKGRPDCVSEWIQRSRPPAWMPAITPSKMETAFHTWWVSLQPKGRVPGKGAIIATDLESGDGWDHLRKPGLNGLVSALVGLFYWGRTLKRSVKQREAWAACVENWILVLRRLVE